MDTKKMIAKKSSRSYCIGNCGKLVLEDECRKCKRKRILAGKRRLAKVNKPARLAPKHETAKQKFDRVKNN